MKTRKLLKQAVIRVLLGSTLIAIMILISNMLNVDDFTTGIVCGFIVGIVSFSK